ncbi:MAG TPA: hypothetical protein VF088_01050 [Pyrinomonadaceae bacterium]
MTCDYSGAARAAYKSMVACFGNEKCSDYWKLGNAFDSLTDYMRWWSGPDIALPSIVYQRYRTLTDPNSLHRSDCWYDDYGWWGIASAKAYDPAYDFFFTGEYKHNFQQIAQFCWRTMNEGKPYSTSGWKYKGAPNVWTNRDNGNPDVNYWNKKENWATPRFDNGVGSGLHGVWQYEIFREKRLNECSPADENPSDPKHVLLGPFQLTVVNALYFLLALRLYNVAKDQSVRQPILDEYGFLRAWFSKALGENSLLLSFGDLSVPPKLLVRERVTTYAEIDGEYPQVKQWANQLGACWNGDQGLMIAALVEVVRMFNDPTAADNALSILKGVVTEMVDQNRVLQPYIGPMGDWNDYKCGVGIFARCLLYAYSQPNSPLKAPIDQNKDDIRAVLLASANDACNNAPYDDLFDNLNLLSLLTAAKMLGAIS